MREAKRAQRSDNSRRRREKQQKSNGGNYLVALCVNVVTGDLGPTGGHMTEMQASVGSFSTLHQQ